MLLYVLLVPVLIFRKMPKDHPADVSVAGIHAVFLSLHSTLPGIIRVLRKVPVGVSGYYTSFLICPKGYTKQVVQDVDVVPVPVLSI